MAIELLEIGTQTDQLAACRLALLMGVFTEDNRIADFLKFTRNMMQTENAILIFQDEPYIWFSSDAGCKPFLAHQQTNLVPYFAGADCIDHSHANYEAFSQQIYDFGAGHERLLAFNLNDGDFPIGQVLLFDAQSASFDSRQKEAVQEFVFSLISIIKLRLENAELKELYEQQSALNGSKTKFFQIIAHDLRAPFHGLLGFSEVLAQERDTLDDSSIQNIADYLHDTAQSTYNLLESLLNWAIAEGGRFAYHPINFELSQSVNIVSNVLNSLAVKKNIQLLNEVPDGLKIYADINMVTSVIQNLVSNALKFTYTDGTGKVVLRACLASNGVRLSIQDTGLGMTPQQLEQLFDPKITVSAKGTSGEKGTGLGLILCKRFIEMNHGEISVESKQGEGSLFQVTFPLALSHHALETRSQHGDKPQETV
ncbi:sensor histidine kinase [Acinetobacter sp.]|jgi:signal transduction histidine kinase|uniref:sensor histidine kinase n=1 Tax=Acinetobacter sp. TaxID=472 RepID=UPI0035B0B8EC